MRKHLPRVARNLAQIDEHLRAAIRRLVAGHAPWPLFLHGPAGTGKTCAMLCLLDYTTGDWGYVDTKYFTAATLADHVVQSQQGRLSWGREGGTLWPDQLWESWRNAQLVVVDELGSRERVSDHHYECVKRILDERHGVPLAMASNHDLDSLAALYDDRVASRLAAGTIVHLVGADRRLEPG